MLSTNRDLNGLEFISTFEGKTTFFYKIYFDFYFDKLILDKNFLFLVIGYPFYGVQWHPEKAPWEWNTDEVNLPHSPDAIAVTQYFTSFLANEG